MRLYSTEFFAMGTPCSVHLYAVDPAQAQAGRAAAEAEVRRLEQKYSRYRPDSYLSEINAVADQGGALDIDTETAALIDFAFGCHRRSEGRFDITSGLLRKAWDFTGSRLPAQSALDRLLPRVGMARLEWTSPRLAFGVAGMELDLGGIVKEYAADRAARACAAEGLAHGLIDLGGDIRIFGPQPAGQPWSIGVRRPDAPETPMAVLDLADGGLASSGAYERFMMVAGRRYCHILDPRTGWPVEGLTAVSVAAPTCQEAGAICTIAMLMGAEAPDWLSGLGYRHVWMDDRGRQGGT